MTGDDEWCAIMRDATYPDLRCPAEMFTNEEMLELETLGPLVHIEPGAGAQHHERWRLLRGISLDDFLRAANQAVHASRLSGRYELS